MGILCVRDIFRNGRQRQQQGYEYDYHGKGWRKQDVFLVLGVVIASLSSLNIATLS